MSYNIIQPPIPSLNFFIFSKDVLKTYHKWFMQQIPVRIAELESYVKEDPSFMTWKADFSEESLEALSNWFVTQIEKRILSKEELRKQKNTLTFPIELDDWDFSPKTYSIMFDLGMYYAEALRKRNPNLKWISNFSASKNYINYGQPEISGFAKSKVPINPFGAMEGKARRIIRGDKVNFREDFLKALEN